MALRIFFFFFASAGSTRPVYVPNTDVNASREKKAAVHHAAKTLLPEYPSCPKIVIAENGIQKSEADAAPAGAARTQVGIRNACAKPKKREIQIGSSKA